MPAHDSIGHGELLWDYGRTSREMGGLSKRQIFRLADEKKITRVRIGARSFIVAQSVRAYVERLAAQGHD
jgi:hypothetical protein